MLQELAGIAVGIQQALHRRAKPVIPLAELIQHGLSAVWRDIHDRIEYPFDLGPICFVHPRRPLLSLPLRP